MVYKAFIWTDLIILPLSSIRRCNIRGWWLQMRDLESADNVNSTEKRSPDSFSSCGGASIIFSYNHDDMSASFLNDINICYWKSDLPTFFNPASGYYQSKEGCTVNLSSAIISSYASRQCRNYYYHPFWHQRTRNQPSSFLLFLKQLRKAKDRGSWNLGFYVPSLVDIYTIWIQ
jgi:hypothetical protein